MTVRIVHKNSTAEDKRPTPGQLANGEIAVNLSEAGAFVSVKDTAGNIQQVGGIKVSDSAPANPVLGTMWVDSDDNTLYVHDGSTWRKVAGGSGSGGQNVIAGDGLDSTQSGNTVTLSVVGGPGIVVVSADDWVAVDLQDDADRTGGNGLELTSADEAGQLRGKIATPSDLGVVRVDDSTIKVNADGVINAEIPQALNFKGNLNITTVGTDAEPAGSTAGDTYTSVPTGTIDAVWVALIDNPPATTNAGDLIICNADGGGANNWTLVPTGGNEVWVEDPGGYVYPSDTSNEVRVPALADGNESTTGTDLAMLDDDGQFVRSEPGTGLIITGGQLEVDSSQIVTYWDNPANTDDLKPLDATHQIMADTLADGTEGVTGTSVAMLDADGRLVRADPKSGIEIDGGQLQIDSSALPADLWQNPVGTTDLEPLDATHQIKADTLADGTEGTTGTSLGMLDDDGRFVRADPGPGLSISGGQLQADAGPALWTDDSGTLHPTTLDSNVEIRDAGDNPVITFNSDGTAEFTGDVTISSDGFLKLPEGDDAARPGTPTAGMVRFTNQDLDPGTGTDPANFVEMYNGSAWVQMLDETAVGTSPDQVPANQMLGQMAFIDHVATLRPYTTPLASTLPVFVGECIVIWDNTAGELVYRYRDTATTYREATVAFGAQVTG